jgi:exodeoxyribonuclease-5
VLDYKTGSKIDTQTWQGDCRITEPQLPLYAAIVLAQPEHSPVAAVAFAKVRLRECEFQGVAAADNLLPDLVVLRAEVTLPPISNASEINQTSEELIDEWKALLDSWKQRLEAIADEIQRGEAAVRFENEQLLAYCEVLPLLRLTERKLQFEKGREGQQ